MKTVTLYTKEEFMRKWPESHAVIRESKDCNCDASVERVAIPYRSAVDEHEVAEDSGRWRINLPGSIAPEDIDRAIEALRLCPTGAFCPTGNENSFFCPTGRKGPVISAPVNFLNGHVVGRRLSRLWKSLNVRQGSPRHCHFRRLCGGRNPQ
jgi:hypothetical protein